MDTSDSISIECEMIRFMDLPCAIIDVFIRFDGKDSAQSIGIVCRSCDSVTMIHHTGEIMGFVHVMRVGAFEWMHGVAGDGIRKIFQNDESGMTGSFLSDSRDHF